MGEEEDCAGACRENNTPPWMWGTTIRTIVDIVFVVPQRGARRPGGRACDKNHDAEALGRQEDRISRSVFDCVWPTSLAERSTTCFRESDAQPALASG